MNTATHAAVVDSDRLPSRVNTAHPTGRQLRAAARARHIHRHAVAAAHTARVDVS
jgi:hypothetical protein